MALENMHKYDLSLYLVTDRGYIGNRKLVKVVQQAVAGGVTAVQLREKNCSTREFIKLGQEIKSRLKNKNIPLIINDRIDIALAIQADGVHLGQEDMPVKMARDILGNDYLIGLSVENMNHIKKAEQLDVDYLGLSPLFVTKTKPELKQEWGLDGLKRARNNSSHPIVAIGNINSGNAAKVIGSGADGIAVVSAICAADDPKRAANQLSTQIRKARTDQ